MNYKENSLAGSSWIRCRTVTITNPLHGTEEIRRRPVSGDGGEIVSEVVGPTAYFQEEKVLSIDGNKIRIDSGSCAKAFAENGVIELRNTETGELTGDTVTHAKLYEILFSLYMQTALERDASALG